eukprot:SAG11_NODE_11458_length_759_cov_1.712121_2_plen_68_part_00
MAAPCVSVLLLYTGLAFIGPLVLCGYHIKLISAATTTNEDIRRVRDHHLARSPQRARVRHQVSVRTR